MDWKTQRMIIADDQQTLNQYSQTLQQFEGHSVVIVHHSLSELHQCIIWRECSWHRVQAYCYIPSWAGAAPPLLHYQNYLQGMFGLKSATANQTLISMERYFAWARKMQLIQPYPANSNKFVSSKTPLWPGVQKEEVLNRGNVVNDIRIRRDRVSTILALHMSLHVQGLHTLAHQNVRLLKPSRTVRIVRKCRKVCGVLLHTTRRVIFHQYAETFPLEYHHLFLSKNS